MKLLITGDFYVANHEAVTIDDGLKEVFTACDYRVVNYEGPVADDHYTVLPLKSGPRLMQPTETKQLLKELGVDALTLANNHIMDYGEAGFNKTVATLKDFTLFGAGRWDEAYRLTTIEKEGLKIGMLNFSELQFGMLIDEWTQGSNTLGCAWVNHPRVNQLIMESKKQVDCLVAIVHAGVEMIDVPLPEWRDRYREMIDLGCDAVIAHHPHVVQGYETYKGKPIAYSLGNFCFSMINKTNNTEWYFGAIAVLNIRKDSLTFNLVGCQLDNGCLKLADIPQWHEKRRKLCEFLADKSYMQKVNNHCNQMMYDYWSLFAMGGVISLKSLTLKNIARMILKKYNSVHLLNNIQCESHRWCISRALRQDSLTGEK